VFQKHHITEAQWDTSLSWYSDRIDLFLKINDSVKARLQRARSDIDRQISQLSVPQLADFSSISPSYIPRTFAFSLPSTRNGIRFQLDSMDIATKISDDLFSFTFSVIGIPSQYKARFTSLLTLQYADTTLYKWQKISENKTYSISASKYIENDTLSQIQGYVHLQDTTAAASQICLYDIFLGNKTLPQ